MSTRRRRQITSWALGLAAVMSGPSLANAQLFQDLPIRRERPCCNQEDPRYQMVREVYFGYYPTCWRQFPEGWGCYPKVGMPDWQASLKERPIDELGANDYDSSDLSREPSIRRTLPLQPGPIGRDEGAQPGIQPGGPPLPPDSGSLFDQGETLRPPSAGSDLPTPPAGTPGTGPARTPRTDSTLPPSNDDLFNPSPSLTPSPDPTPTPTPAPASSPAGTTPPETNLQSTPSGLPPATDSTQASGFPLIEAPSVGSGTVPSTSPEVLLEGELPQAPPLGAPAPNASPVSHNLEPIPMIPPNQAQPAPASASNSPRRTGILAGLLGKTRKR